VLGGQNLDANKSDFLFIRHVFEKKLEKIMIMKLWLWHTYPFQIGVFDLEIRFFQKMPTSAKDLSENLNFLINTIYITKGWIV